MARASEFRIGSRASVGPAYNDPTNHKIQGSSARPGISNA